MSAKFGWVNLQSFCFNSEKQILSTSRDLGKLHPNSGNTHLKLNKCNWQKYTRQQNKLTMLATTARIFNIKYY